MNRYSERFKFLSKDGLSSASCVALTTDLSPSTMAFSDIRIVQAVFVLLSWHSSFSFGVNHDCPREFALVGDMCLTLPSDALLSWPNALGKCQDLGGTLLKINNADEQKLVEDFITNHYSASSLSIDLPPVYKYHYVDDLNTFIRQEKYIQFKVKGCNDAHLILSENRNDSFQSYEIVIGGWGDTTSVIRSCRQCQHRAVKYHTPISCTEYKPFWVSWRNGTIRVGEGQEVGTGVFMEWTDPNPHPVKFIGFSSWSDHPTQWMFQKDAYNATFWLSGTELGHSGQWEWFPEEDFIGYTHWVPEGPSSLSSSGHCLQMSLHNAFRWAADNCMQMRNFICEIPTSSNNYPIG
uniref:Uncharacterized protein LOC111136752 isoform X1 n=1 Tax=Crassostrea virginica TaxID=6565 RepID=A0A8B8EUA3_CRAVI|nr:uncharacterized protein LOC111136752 isoform X1 [Crassostrea virginica]